MTITIVICYSGDMGLNRTPEGDHRLLARVPRPLGSISRSASHVYGYCICFSGFRLQAASKSGIGALEGGVGWGVLYLYIGAVALEKFEIVHSN